MKKVATLAAALLVLAASSAFAQGGLNLYWNGCSDGGVSTQTFACNSNSGFLQAAYATCVVPSDVPTFVGTSVVVDITVNDTALPAWWQMATGQCRAGALSISCDPAVNASNCTVDLWAGTNPTTVSTVQNAVHGLANELRLNAAAALTGESPVAADGTEYFVAKISMSKTKSTGTGSCAGCTTGACIVLNEMKLQTTLNAADVTVSGPAVSNFVTYNAGSPTCTQATPAQNRTWGAVKNLYR
jgi:hypothetical protein